MIAPVMPAPPEPVRYHRLGLTYRLGPYAWWRPLLELILAAVLGITFMLIWIFSVEEFLYATDYPLPVTGDYFDLDESDPASKVLLYGGLGAMLPAAFLAARITGRRPRALWSVANRFRWKLFWLAMLIVVLWWAGTILIDAAIAGSFTGPTAMPLDGRLWLTIYLLVICLPLQCAAEEVIFRGTCSQVFGAWVRSPWVAYLPGIPLFIIGHDYELSLLVFIGIFAVMTTVLIHRTGGLEVAIAYHIGNNLSVEYNELSGLADIDIADRPSIVLVGEFSNWLLFAVLLLVFRGLAPRRNEQELYTEAANWQLPQAQLQPQLQPWPVPYPPQQMPQQMPQQFTAYPPPPAYPTHYPPQYPAQYPGQYSAQYPFAPYPGQPYQPPQPHPGERNYPPQGRR